jgi:hypothetical protein
LIVYIFPYKSIGWDMLTITCYTNSHQEYPAILKINTFLSLILKELFIDIYIRAMYQ